MTVNNRYDFMFLFDVIDGNPNGDPDADNLPRIDVETNMGKVTDVCLKRKIRNYVQAVKENVPGYDIYIQESGTLTERDEWAKNQVPDDMEGAVQKMCERFFDVRTFGAVMTGFVKKAKKGKNEDGSAEDSKATGHDGRLTGPVQFTPSTSVDPIVPMTMSITRMAVTTQKDKENKGNHTMGRKHIVPYALYVGRGFVSAGKAAKTGFSEEDLQLLWDAIMNMFEFDRSAARGQMSLKKLIVFKHDSKFGNDHADRLFSRVHVQKKDGVMVPRSYADYDVEIDTSGLKQGITVLVSDDNDTLQVLA